MAKMPKNLTIHIGVSKKTIRELKKFKKEVEKIQKQLLSLRGIILKNQELLTKSKIK